MFRCENPSTHRAVPPCRRAAAPSQAGLLVQSNILLTRKIYREP